MRITPYLITTDDPREEGILISSVREIRVRTIRERDYRAGVPVYLFLGVVFLFFVPPLGLWFLLMGVGCFVYVRNKYALVINTRAGDRIIFVGSRRQARRFGLAISSALKEQRQNKTYQKEPSEG
jgi:hypothetical protein